MYEIILKSLVLVLNMHLSIEVSVTTTSTTSFPNTESCVVVFSNQNDKAMYRKFVYTRQRCINFNLKHAILANNYDAATLIKEVWELDLKYCTVVMAFDRQQQNLLFNLFTSTHRVLSDFSQDMVSKSILTKLTTSSKTSCMETQHIYIKTLTMLIQHATIDLVVILVHQEECDVAFANTLANNIRAARAAEHSTAFKVMIYELERPQSMSPKELLLEVQQHSQSRRIFIMLTSIEVTKLFFEASIETRMNQHVDIWIAKHSTYSQDMVPAQTLTFTEIQYKEYRPISSLFHKSIFNSSYAVNNSICTYSTQQTLSRLAQEVGILNETKEVLKVRLWWRNEWKVIYDVTSATETFVIMPHVTGFGFLGALGVNHLETLKVVSVLEAPFLHIEDYLYDVNHSVCDTGSLVCKVPFTEKSGSTAWKKTCCYGYSVDLIKQLSEYIGFQADVYIVEDGKYGGYDNSTGTFNGMVGDVVNKKADMAVAGLTINTGRLPHVEFTIPFMRAEIGIVTLKQITIADYFTFDFITMLGNDALYGIGGAALLAMILIYGFDNVVLHYEWQHDKSFRERTKLKMYSLADCFTYTSALLFQRELGGVSPSTKSGRVVAIMFAFAMVAATTLYTASLTADRVIQSESNEFLGLKDSRMINPTDKFKFATSKYTSIEDFFRVAPDEALNRMYHFMKPYNVENLKDGIYKVLSGELQAYLNEYPFLKYYITQLSNCQLEIHENSIGQASYGIAVAKDADIKYDLSRGILYLQEEGILLDLEKKWLSSRCGETPTQKEFSLTFFTMPLLILTGAIILAVLILLTELLIGKYLRRFKKAYKISGSIYK